MDERNREILAILRKNATTPVKDVAAMVGASEQSVRDAIASMEKNGIIVKYNTVVDMEKVDEEYVEALIEVRTTPQKKEGFDALARRIAGFDEVQSVYLMSGDYDLMVLVGGTSLKKVAMFVSDRLAGLEGVVSTSTHFVLKKYKEQGTQLKKHEEDERLVITP
jgi:DNA-binding Lrp family transcriptional regulator